VTREMFLRTLTKSRYTGHSEIVRVLAPNTPIPDEKLFREVLDAWRDQDVVSVVLQKAPKC
jgi:hypothetical protein